MEKMRSCETTRTIKLTNQFSKLGEKNMMKPAYANRKFLNNLRYFNLTIPNILVRENAAASLQNKAERENPSNQK